MSSTRPVVTLSSPKIISSATRPPNGDGDLRLQLGCGCRSSLSRSGRHMTMPSARPRGMIVDLVQRVATPAYAARPARGRPRDRRSASSPPRSSPWSGARRPSAPCPWRPRTRPCVTRRLRAARGQQRRLVDEVGEIGAGEAGRAARDDARDRRRARAAPCACALAGSSRGR